MVGAEQSHNPGASYLIFPVYMEGHARAEKRGFLRARLFLHPSGLSDQPGSISRSHHFYQESQGTKGEGESPTKGEGESPRPPELPFFSFSLPTPALASHV